VRELGVEFEPQMSFILVDIGIVQNPLKTFTVLLIGLSKSGFSTYFCHGHSWRLSLLDGLDAKGCAIGSQRRWGGQSDADIEATKTANGNSDSLR